MNQLTFIRPENFTDLVYLIPVRCKVCGKVLATQKLLDGLESYIDRKNRELAVQKRLNDVNPPILELEQFFVEQKIYKQCCRASITGKTSMQPNPYYHGVTVPRLESSIMSGHQLTLKRKHVFALSEAEESKLSSENPIIVEDRAELEAKLRSYTKMFRISGRNFSAGIPTTLIVKPVRSLVELEDYLTNAAYIQVFDENVSKLLAKKSEHKFTDIFKLLEEGYYEYNTSTVGEVEQLISRTGRIFVASPEIRKVLPTTNVEVISSSTDLPRVKTGTKPITLQLNDKDGRAATVVRIGHNIKTGNVFQGAMPTIVSTEPIRELILDNKKITAINYSNNEDLLKLLNRYKNTVHVLIHSLTLGSLSKATKAFDPVYELPVKNITELRRLNNTIAGVYFISPELLNRVVDPEDPFNLIRVDDIKKIPDRRSRLPAPVINKPIVAPETKPVASMDIVVPKTSTSSKPRSDMVIIVPEEKLTTKKNTLSAKAVEKQLKEYKSSNSLMSGFSTAKQIIIPKPGDLGENFTNRRYGLPKYIAMPNVAGPYSYNTSTFTPAAQNIVVNSSINSELILAEMERNKQYDIRPLQ